jgi:hypothetical protein
VRRLQYPTSLDAHLLDPALRIGPHWKHISTLLRRHTDRLGRRCGSWYARWAGWWVECISRESDTHVCLGQFSIQHPMLQINRVHTVPNLNSAHNVPGRTSIPSSTLCRSTLCRSSTLQHADRAYTAYIRAVVAVGPTLLRDPRGDKVRTHHVEARVVGVVGSVACATLSHTLPLSNTLVTLSLSLHLEAF